MNFGAIFIGETVFNANLSIKVIGPFDGDFCFFRDTGYGDLMVFSTVAGSVALGFSPIDCLTSRLTII